MATPHVAGAFAAIRTAIGSGPSVTTILNALINTGKSVSDTRAGGSVTKPRIQVDSALSTLVCSGSPTLTVSPQSQLKYYGPNGGPFYSDAYAFTAAPFALSNHGVGNLNYSISAPDWLALSSTSGTLGCGDTVTIGVLPGPSVLGAGAGTNLSSTILVHQHDQRTGQCQRRRQSDGVPEDRHAVQLRQRIRATYPDADHEQRVAGPTVAAASAFCRPLA